MDDDNEYDKKREREGLRSLRPIVWALVYAAAVAAGKDPVREADPAVRAFESRFLSE